MRLDRSVTIYRDEFGVAHISGKTDEAVFFGSGYAQAEDNLAAIESNYLRVLGRAAELRGEGALAEDLVTRALEIPYLSQREYARAPGHIQRLCTAFTAGLNQYVRERKRRPLAVLEQFEPWHVLAIYRRFHLAALYAAGFRAHDIFTALPEARPRPPRRSKRSPEHAANEFGSSNAWAIAPERTRSGHALLLSSPHVAFGSLYEIHLHSGSGLNFYGTGFWGMPIPALGTNHSLGWSLTVNNPPVVDFIAESCRGRAAKWEETVRIRARAGCASRIVTFRKTSNGPIMAVRDGTAVAVRIALLAEGGALAQFLAMAKAGGLRSFKKALGMGALLFHNVVYADGRGNILYQYSGAIPRRGANPERREYFSVNDLPRVENPACGFVQNCNSHPFLTTSNDPVPSGKLPAGLLSETDTARARWSRKILASRGAFTASDLCKLAFDRRVPEAARLIRELLLQYRKASSRPHTVRAPLRVLETWDCVASEQSVAMTLFVYWSHEFRMRSSKRGEAVAALEHAIRRLNSIWGKWAVPWGEISRLQRPTRGRRFRDDRPSIASPGGPGWTGIQFVFETVASDQKRRYGVFGNSLPMVVEFTKPAVVWSVAVFGQSADPRSRHFFDQAPLYACGGMKNVRLELSRDRFLSS